jgi:hypothetical protein
VRFEKGYLETLPLESGSADVMLSNCVLNLSGDKRSTFAEILRVLSNGGRLIVSDVVCESDPPASVRSDPTLRGECIAGALTMKDLAGLLEETGFRSLEIIKKLPYRVVHDHPFFSLTFEARKPPVPDADEVGTAGDGIERFFERSGDIDLSRWDSGTSCCSCSDPHDATPGCGVAPKLGRDCMVCGEPLEYFSSPKEAQCSYCEKTYSASALCRSGHYVCDGCHAEDALEAIENICLTTQESDMIRLLELIRAHNSVPMHGPEHHALIPGVILAAFRNIGGAISDDTIRTGIERGSQTPGGHCGFAGSCGAAIGVGIAFGLILESNPLKKGERSALLSAVSEVLQRISLVEAARCCQRESFIALTAAAELSTNLLPIPLKAEAPLICRQSRANPECIKALCPVVQRSKRPK